MKEPVTVTAYISEELPPDFARLRRDFKDELTEYSNRSGGKVLFEFVNPNKDEQSEQKAMQEGIQPVLINVREKDQMKQQKAYMGAVVHYGEKKEVIPFIQPGAAMEYSLSTSIKKLADELDSQFNQSRMEGAMPPPPPSSSGSADGTSNDTGFTKDELTSQLSQIGSSDSKRSTLISNIV